MISLRTAEGRNKYLRLRKKKLEELRASAGNLDPVRVGECIESVIKGYENATNIKYMARIVKEEDLENYGFRSIGLHYIIDKDKFLAKDYYWGHYFTDVGRAIARGEEKYLHRRISRISESYSKSASYENLNLAIVNDAIKRLLEKDITPNVLLIPIELYSKFVKHYYDKFEWSINRQPQLMAEGCKLNVFLSNKYAPLRSIMIFNSNAGMWHVLEDVSTKGNLSVAIGESEQRKDKIEYFVETLAYYHAVNKEAFVKIKLATKEKG